MSTDVTLPDGVGVQAREGGLEWVVAQTPHGSLELCLHGSQVTSWVPTGGRDVFWLSPSATFAEGTPIRGGIPLCGPWFGKDGSPSHGWFRRHVWTLTGAERDGDEVLLSTSLAAADIDARPAVVAYLRVRLGTELSVELTISAERGSARITDALHSYLAVSDAASVRVEGLDGSFYASEVEGSGTQSGPVTLGGEVDRRHSHSGECSVVDEAWGRRIVVSKEGSASTVVWNPGPELGERMADVGDGWRSFVCVEPANTDGGAVDIAPGRWHRMTARYRVEPLD